MPAPGPGKACAHCGDEMEEEYVVYENRAPNSGSETYFCSEECLRAFLNERA